MCSREHVHLVLEHSIDCVYKCEHSIILVICTNIITREDPEKHFRHKQSCCFPTAHASVCEVLKYYSFLQYLSDNNTRTATLLFVTDLHLQTACEYVSKVLWWCLNSSVIHLLLYDITGEECKPLPQSRAEHDHCQLQQFRVNLYLLPGLKFSPGAEEQHGGEQRSFNWREMTWLQHVGMAKSAIF